MDINLFYLKILRIFILLLLLQNMSYAGLYKTYTDYKVAEPLINEPKIIHTNNSVIVEKPHVSSNSNPDKISLLKYQTALKYLLVSYYGNDMYVLKAKINKIPYKQIYVTKDMAVLKMLYYFYIEKKYKIAAYYYKKLTDKDFFIKESINSVLGIFLENIENKLVQEKILRNKNIVFINNLYYCHFLYEDKSYNESKFCYQLFFDKIKTMKFESLLNFKMLQKIDSKVFDLTKGEKK